MTLDKMKRYKDAAQVWEEVALSGNDDDFLNYKIRQLRSLYHADESEALMANWASELMDNASPEQIHAIVEKTLATPDLKVLLELLLKLSDFAVEKHFELTANHSWQLLRTLAKLQHLNEKPAESVESIQLAIDNLPEDVDDETRTEMKNEQQTYGVPDDDSK